MRLQLKSNSVELPEREARTAAHAVALVDTLDHLPLRNIGTLHETHGHEPAHRKLQLRADLNVPKYDDWEQGADQIREHRVRDLHPDQIIVDLRIPAGARQPVPIGLGGLTLSTPYDKYCDCSDNQAPHQRVQKVLEPSGLLNPEDKETYRNLGQTNDQEQEEFNNVCPLDVIHELFQTQVVRMSAIPVMDLKNLHNELR